MKINPITNNNTNFKQYGKNKFGILGYAKCSRYFSGAVEYNPKKSKNFTYMVVDYDFKQQSSFIDKIINKAKQIITSNNYQGNGAKFALDFLLRSNFNKNRNNWSIFDTKKLQQLFTQLTADTIIWRSDIQTKYYWDNNIPYEGKDREDFLNFMNMVHSENKNSTSYLNEFVSRFARRVLKEDNFQTDKSLYALDCILRCDYEREYRISDSDFKFWSEFLGKLGINDVKTAPVKVKNVIATFAIERFTMLEGLSQILDSNNDGFDVNKILKDIEHRKIELDTYMIELLDAYADKRIFQKLRKSYQENGELTLDELVQFSEYKQLNKISRLPLNIVGETVAHMLADIKIDENNYDDVQKVKRILTRLSRGVINQKDDFGVTPLSKAIEAENTVIANLLKLYGGKK